MNNDNNQGQSIESIEDNISFFKNNIDSYSSKVEKLDTYIILRSYINKAIQGIETLLDIGNGGVFDYDTSLIKKIVGLDLFLDKLPSTFSCPPNVILRTGSALDIPDSENTYDGVLMVMLIHHLIGKNVKSSIQNVKKTIAEAHRVLKPGGKMIITESCVPQWFYHFQKLVFPLTSRLVDKIFKHPATLQYSPSMLKEMLEEKFKKVEITKVPLGKWVIIYGLKVPSIITPVSATIFTASKE